jgi:hypothetical protein
MRKSFISHNYGILLQLPWRASSFSKMEGFELNMNNVG